MYKSKFSWFSLVVESFSVVGGESGCVVGVNTMLQSCRGTDAAQRK